MSWLFSFLSDRRRPAKMLFLFVVLLALSYYSFERNQKLTAAWLSNIPEGAPRTLTHFEVIAVAEGNMTVAVPDGRFPLVVSPAPRGVKVGDILNMEVEKRDGKLRVLAVENRALRRWKIWLSLPVLLLIAALLVRDFRWQAASKVFVLRDPEHA